MNFFQAQKLAFMYFSILFKTKILRLFLFTLNIHTVENIHYYTCTTLHAIFLLTVWGIRVFFSLKPSSSQGQLSLKISTCLGSPIWRSGGTNKQIKRQTHSQTGVLIEMLNLAVFVPKSSYLRMYVYSPYY